MDPEAYKWTNIYRVAVVLTVESRGRNRNEYLHPWLGLNLLAMILSTAPKSSLLRMLKKW